MRAIVLACTFIALAPASSAADAISDARKAIESAYARQSSAIEQGDIAGYLATLTKDFVSTDRAGLKETLRDKKAQLSGLKANSARIRRSVVVRSVSLSGDTAKVAARETLDADLVVKFLKPVGRDRKRATLEQKRANLHAETTLEDTWIKVGGKWLRKASRALTEKKFLDGKEIAAMR
jgi:hypothetical protein